jgi:hypothetical protein
MNRVGVGHSLAIVLVYSIKLSKWFWALGYGVGAGALDATQQIRVI